MMGQTIDLLATTTTTVASENQNELQGEEAATVSHPVGQDDEKEEFQRLQLADEECILKRREKIHAALHSLSHRELLQAVLQVQQDRVATYREYEQYVY